MATPYLWFKMWLDILDDPKMHKLRDRDFRTFVNLCGFAKEADLGGKIPLSTGEISYRLRQNEAALALSIGRLIKALPGGVSQLPDGSIMLNNFRKRQEAGSKERTKKWREKRHGDGHGDGGSDGHGDVDCDAKRFREENIKKDLREKSHGDAGAPPAGAPEAPPPERPTPTPKGPRCSTSGCDRIGTIREVNSKDYLCRKCYAERDKEVGIPGINSVGSIK